MRNNFCLKAAALSVFFIFHAFFVIADGKIAVFPYYSPGNALPAEYEYALFTVPDIIRMNLVNDNRFAVVSNSELRESVSKAGLASDYFTNEALCLEAAAVLDADYIIRGYIHKEDQVLTVMHFVLSVPEGEILHIGKQALSSDTRLIGELEASAGNLTGWVNRELPDAEPEVVVVEREKIIEKEKIVEVPVETHVLNNNFQLGTGASWNIYFYSMEEYLEPNLSLDLDFYFRPAEWEYFSVGFELSFEVLNQKQSFFEESDQEIDVLLVPVLLSARYGLPLLPVLDLDFSAGAGGAVIFGLVEPEIIAYFRPAASLYTGLVLFPDELVSVNAGVSAFLTLYAYNSIHLTSWAPSLKLYFNF